ncbi:MAG: ATP-binding protein [Actinomycetia bacterium]|nr:ATP-binding protein [Actinomycetes bacterium]MCP3913658.1 ATP-binding protein [Actinomycetes bacterium]MCP4086846.1 ATP-binding protein [Actinomycetes bacterium]
MSTGRLVELEFPARTDYVSLARVVVAAVAGVEEGFSDASVDDLRVAVSEATTNAVEATSAAALGETGAETAQRVGVECRLFDDRVEIQVTNHGHGFDLPAQPQMPELEEEGWLPDGGFGLPLMMLLADEHEFDTHDEGTRVKLVKYIDRVF